MTELMPVLTGLYNVITSGLGKHMELERLVPNINAYADDFLRLSD